jgi:hypothetical protein
LQLNALDEIRKFSLQHTKTIQQKRKKVHNNHIQTKEFSINDWALLYDSRYKENQGKLTTRWLGPYEIENLFDNGLV